MSTPEQSTATEKPYRHHLGRRIVGGLLISVIIAMITALLFLNFWIVPRIDQYRSFVEQTILARMGVTVQIDAITAQRNGLLPRIEVHSIRLLHPNGQTALSIEKVQAALSFKSLLGLNLRFSELVIQKPLIDIQRQSNGNILIAGFEITPQPRPTPLNPNNNITLPDAVLWLSKQPEISIQQGRVQWSDASNTAPVLELSDIDIVLSNQRQNHHITMQATPSAGWGERFTFKGDFTSPLLLSSKHLHNWNGSAYALFPQANIEQLNHYITLPIEIAQGRGFVEVSAQYKQGDLIQTRATLDLQEVEIQTAPDDPSVPSVHLQNLKGTVTGSWQANTYRVQSDDLSFHTPSQSLKNGTTLPSQTWRPSHWDISWEFDDQGALSGGIIQTADVHLETLAQLAKRLPLPSSVQDYLTQINPQGYIETLNLQWQGTPTELRTYSLSGNIHNLTLTSGIAQPPPPGKKMSAGRPGVKNLNIRFAIDEKTGLLQLAMENGMVSLPGVFENPDLPVERALINVNWKHIENGQISVTSPDLEVITNDAELRLQIHWLSPDPLNEMDTAGFIKLTGTLTNGKATAVHRYLPMSIQQRVRDYLKAALIAGSVPQANIHMEGPLADFPYHKVESGIFVIEGQAQDVTLDYAPEVVRPSGQGPWPVLTHINGLAQFTGKGMLIRNATGRLLDAPDTHAFVQEVSIPDWSIKDTHVLVEATLQGPANQQLYAINQSTLGRDLLQGLLSSTTATGNITTELNLDIAVERMPTSEIKGQVNLEGNTVSLWPFLPQLGQTQGHLIFTQRGISIPRLNARTLGGALQASIQWDMKQGLSIQAHGDLSAEGLLHDPNWRNLLAPELQWLDGKTTYTVTADSADKLRRIHVQSDLNGLALKLPDPLHKPESESYPLSLTITPLAPNNQFIPMSLELITQPTSRHHPHIQANYILNKTNAGIAVTQGTIGINRELRMPMKGTNAQVQLESLNIPLWQAYLAALPLDKSAFSPSNLLLPAWWPQSTDVNIGELWLGNNFVAHNTQIALQRTKQNWNAQINSDEIRGQLQWRAQTSPANPSILRVRLSRLWLPEINLLKPHDEFSGQTAVSQHEQFTLLPNIQGYVDHFRFGNIGLGKLTLGAHIDHTVVPARWQIDNFQLETEHTVVTGKGYWANTPIPTTSAQLTLETKNTGLLLTQIGFPGIIANAPGKLQGELSWQAIPYQLDRETLSGHLALQLGKGEFLVTDPGAGRLLSMLSLQSLENRASMDFRDITEKGLAFNNVNGQFVIHNGVLNISTLGLKGVNASVETTGQIDLINQTQKLHVVAAPEINAGAASLALIAVNPAAGVGSLVAQMVLREPLRQAATRVYYVSGSWKKPHVSTTPFRAGNRTKTNEQKTAPSVSP